MDVHAPDVAVLIPVRNAAPWIAATIDSTLSQSYAQFVIILVDDGSVDGTAAVAAGAAAGDPRLKILTLPPSGITAALNAGLAAVPASAPFVARMDGDDVMHPERLRLQRDFMLARPEVDVLGTRVAVLRDVALTASSDRFADGMDRYVGWLNSLAGTERIAHEIFVESPVCHPTVMMRRSTLSSVGGYRDNPWTEDYDLWLRLHLAGARFWTLPDVLHTWRDHGRRVTRTDARCSAERFFWLKAHYLVQGFGDRFRIWGAGRDGLRLARALEREGATIETFLDVDPRKVGRTRRDGVPVRSHLTLTGPGDGPTIVSAVGIPRARMEIRGMLGALSYIESTHYVCAA